MPIISNLRNSVVQLRHKNVNFEIIFLISGELTCGAIIHEWCETNKYLAPHNFTQMRSLT